MNLLPQFIRNAFAAPTKEAPLPTEAAWSESSMYRGADFPKYNPDDLLTRKGYAVYRKMMIDEQVKAVVRFKRDAITSRDYVFLLDDSDLSEEEIDLRKAVFAKAITDMTTPFTDALNGIMSAMYNGFSITEKLLNHFEYDGRTWYGVDKLKQRPCDSFLFHTDAHGNVEKFVQQFEAMEQELDITAFIHFVQNPDFDTHYGRSELRECYRAWFSKDMVIKFQNIHLERFAAGFVWAAPKEGKVLTAGTPEFTSLQNVMKNLQATSSIILPSGIELNIEHPATTDAFERAIAQHDKAIAKALLVPNLLGISEQGSTGSFAQSKTQLEAFLWTLDANATRLEQTLNVQLFKQLGDLNFGDGKYPVFKFKPVSDERKLEIVKIWMTLVTAGAVQATDLDEAYIRDALEMPKKVVIEGDAPDLILNGAQVQSLVGIVAQVGAGTISPEAAKAVITAVFPITPEQAAAMVDTAKVEKPASTEPTAGAGAAGDEGADDEGADDEGGAEENQLKVGEDGKPVLDDQGKPMMEETVVGKMGISVSAFTKAMKRVDFAVIANKADNTSEDTAYELAAINSAAVARLVALAEELKLGTADGNPDDLNKITFSPAEVASLKNATTKGLKEAWNIGESHAKKELAKAKFGRNFWNEDQPRNEDGTWGEGGGASTKGSSTKLVGVETVFKHPMADVPDDFIPVKDAKMAVPFSDLVPSQDSIDLPSVEKKAASKTQGRIEVIADKDNYIILDGHHSAVAAKDKMNGYVNVIVIGKTKGTSMFATNDLAPRSILIAKFGRNFWNEDQPRNEDGKFAGGGAAVALGPDRFNEGGAADSSGAYASTPLQPLKGKQIREAVSNAYQPVIDAYGSPEYIDPASVMSGQRTVNVAKVEEYVSNPAARPSIATGRLSSELVVVKRGGALAVIDGNHRLAAALLSGTKIQAIVVDMDAAFHDAAARQQPGQGLGSALLESAKAKGATFATNDLALQDVAAKYLKAKGYTLAGDISNATQKTIRNILMEGVKVSKTHAETKQAIYKALESDGLVTEEAVVEALGASTAKQANARIATAIRTTAFEAINEARYQLFSDPDLQGFVEALEYSSILDDRTTEICQQLNGQTYGIDSEEWSTFRPPNHFNCRSILVPVTVRDTWTQSDAPTVNPQKGFGFNRTCNHKGHNHA